MSDKIDQALFLFEIEGIKATCYDVHLLEQLVFIKKMINQFYDVLLESEVDALYSEMAKIEQEIFRSSQE